MVVVNVKIINTYLRGLMSVLEPLGLHIELQEVKLYESAYLDPTAMIVSQLSGGVEGEIIIGMTDETFACLIESFQIPVEMADEEMKRSILTEVGDMVRGHAITGFQSLGIPIEFTKVDLLNNLYPDTMSLLQVSSLHVTVLANGQYPMYIHFILDELYRV